MSNDMISPNAGLVVGAELEAMLGNATMLMASGLVPQRFKNPEAVVITAMYGRGLGLDFTASIAEVYIVNGVPSCSSKIQQGIIKKREPGCKIRIIEQVETICRVSIQRANEDEAQPFQYTIEEAKKAGLLSKSTWQKHPVDMLTARALTRAFRSTCMDLLGGFGHTPEELEEVATFDPKKVTKRAGMPKKGDTVDAMHEIKQDASIKMAEAVDAEITAVDVESEVVEEKHNVTVISGLTKELKGTDQQDLAELIYDSFREKNAEDQETLAKGYEIFEKRKQELGGSGDNKD